MNSGKNVFIGVGAVILAAIVYSSLFVVNEWETALKLRLGKIVDSNYEPGLHWRWPIINEVKKFDRRIQTLDAQPQRFLTVEKKDVIVDSFAKWRIADVAQFYRSTGGDSAKTSRLLSERINTGLARMMVFALVGTAAAFAGVLASLHVSFFWPSLGDGYLLRTLAAVFLGGTSVFGGVGTIFGTFIGSFIIGAIEAAIVAIGLTGFWTQLIYGLIIIVSVSMHTILRNKIG